MGERREMVKDSECDKKVKVKRENEREKGKQR